MNSVADLENVEEYSLVWQDEFNEHLNIYNDTDENWQFQYCSGWADDLQLKRNSETVYVRSDGTDSYLSMRTVKTDQVTEDNGYSIYNTAVPITTCGKMSFLYGYLEIRASVPYGQGIYPSFWLKTTNAQYRDETLEAFVGDPKLGYKESALYDTEVDIFESFGNNNIIPNIHKWWKKSTNVSQKGVSGQQIGNYIERTTADISFGKEYDVNRKEWHTYGFEWTEEKMSFYVDGKIYETFDLTTNFGSDEDGYGMTGFKESPVSVILGLKAFSREAVEEKAWASGRTPLDDSKYNAGDIVSEYDVDYIRLYQKDNGKIWTR